MSTWCVCCLWCSRRRFRPASSVPSPRNCSPLSHTWTAAKNEDSSASNWQVELYWHLSSHSQWLMTFTFIHLLAICLHIPVLLVFHQAHEYWWSISWYCSSSLCHPILYRLCLCVWLHLLQFTSVMLLQAHCYDVKLVIIIRVCFTAYVYISHCYIDSWLIYCQVFIIFDLFTNKCFTQAMKMWNRILLLFAVVILSTCILFIVI